MTEKFLLYGGAIAQAGEVKGKRAKAATSDWMEIEKQRGISVTSSVMQFQHNGFCINILDTPGHQDFSEDTYRTLMAADSAVMVIDGAKVVINGEQFDSWQDAHARYHHGWDREERWYEPCGYTVRGERFDSIDDARAKYGDEVGKSIPVRKHYLREFEKSWVKFPVSARGHRRVPAAGHFERRVGHGVVSVPDHSLVLHGGSRHRAQAPRAAGVGRVSHRGGGLVLLDGVRAEPAASRLGGLSHHSRSGVARA